MSKKRVPLVLILPVAIWIIFCLCEWILWIKVPYSFFYSRGVNASQVDYQTVTVGDMVTGNIFVTPVPRLTHYVTDQYGNRNTTIPEQVDILIYGSSVAAGGGESHENTPAVQLSRVTGKHVLLVSGEAYPYKARPGFEAMSMIIEKKWPRKPKVILYFVVDGDMMEPLQKHSKAIQDWEFTLGERFSLLKKYIKDYSPQAILSRKLTTTMKAKILAFLYHKDLVHRQSKTLQYLDHQGRVYADLKLPAEWGRFNANSAGLNYMVSNLKLLHQQAKEQGMVFIPVIIPRKYFAYYSYFNHEPLKGYGPGEVLYQKLKQEGIEAIFPHPVIFKAVKEEMEHGRMPVFWSDDTHMSGYGIALETQVIKNFLQHQGLL